MTSVVMFPAALMYQKGRLGMHVPGISGCQNLGMGVQVKMTTRSWDIDHVAMTTMASIMATLVRTVPAPKMRWYWSRKVSFVAVKEALYSTMDT
jgi:hypothetical protein